MASQYPLQTDELNEVLDEDESVSEELEDEEVEVEAFTSTRLKTSAELGKASRERLREELNRQVEAFLARGGHIHQVPSNFHKISPKNTVSDFGDRLM